MKFSMMMGMSWTCPLNMWLSILHGCCGCCYRFRCEYFVLFAKNKITINIVIIPKKRPTFASHPYILCCEVHSSCILLELWESAPSLFRRQFLFHIRFSGWEKSLTAKHEWKNVQHGWKCKCKCKCKDVTATCTLYDKFNTFGVRTTKLFS